MTELEIYEKKFDAIKEENARMLQLFEEDMVGLKPKTIDRHLDNVEFS